MGLFSTDVSNAYDKVKVPTANDLRVTLQGLVQQGLIEPAQAEAVLQQQSEYNQIEEDPRLRESQMDTISNLEDIVGAGGMDAQMRQALYNAENEMRAANQGAQGAIMDNARARGVGGSNLEFTNRLIAQQGAATRGAQSAVDAAAAAEQRRMLALQALGTQAGNVRGQDFGVASSKAAAQDAINRFNAANQQAVGLQNVNTANTAQQANLAEKQRVSDVNADIRNQQEMHNRFTAPTQATQLALQRAGGQFQQDQAEDKKKQQLIQMGGNALQQGAMVLSDEDEKEEVRPFDSGKVLAELTGVKYRYKDPEHDTGEPEVGVMAQDLERVAPAAVVEGEDGAKQIDYGKMGGFMLAALAELNDRLARMEGENA